MKTIYLKKANSSDIDRIMEIVRNAQENLKINGVPQWQDGYPDKNNILNDINQNTLYEIMFNGKIAGIIAIQYEPETNYDTLKTGSWNNDKADYATIHRVAIDTDFSGNNVARFAFASAFSIIKDNGISIVRTDTHRLNRRMTYLLANLGFEYQGVVQIIDPHGNLETDGYEIQLG